MRAHILTIAAAMTLGAPATAEPAKAPVQKADQAIEQPVVLIASASEVPGVQQPQQPAITAPPARPVRHARVMTCRCGDQNPSK